MASTQFPTNCSSPNAPTEGWRDLLHQLVPIYQVFKPCLTPPGQRQTASNAPLQPGSGQQLVPVIWRMTALQHLAKHPVCVFAALISALGVLIVDPREDDHLAGCVVTEEEPVLLEELCPVPVFQIAAKGVALAVFRMGWVFRDDVESELGNSSQSLAEILPHIPGWLFFLQGVYLLRQRLNLREEQRVSKDRSAANDQGRVLARDHSSSADSAVSRATSMLPTSDWSRWKRWTSNACRRSGWLRHNDRFGRRYLHWWNDKSPQLRFSPGYRF